MADQLSLDSGTIRLLEQASELRLLGLMFEYPRADWREQVASLLPSLRRTDLREMAQSALDDFTEGLHIALFGPAGTVPVREVTWLGGVQFGYLMAELAAYYEAFGYSPSVDEAPDHLAVQLGFLSFLRVKEVHAVLSGNADSAQVTAEAAATFLKEHVAVQAEPVLRALENFAPDFLIAAGRRVVDHAGPSPRSDYPLSPTLGDDDEAISCGPSAAADGDLIQLQP